MKKAVLIRTARQLTAEIDARDVSSPSRRLVVIDVQDRSLAPRSCQVLRRHTQHGDNQVGNHRRQTNPTSQSRPSAPSPARSTAGRR